MIIYPAIDLKEGQCVRLVQGDKDNKTVYSNNPGMVAKSFQEQGAEYLHVVDLDGAFTGSPSNTQAIKDIAASVAIPFQVGGGLRTLEDVARTLALGAARVIIGTKAFKNPDFIKELLDKFGNEKIVLGLDARQGMVAIEGWVEKSSISALDFGQKMHAMGIKTAIYTDVAKDGLLQGPNLPAIKEMAAKTGLKIIASGGVSSYQNILDLKALENLGVVGAIVGKAIYDGKLDLEETLTAIRKEG